jgi:hypothetical protein
MKEGLALNDGYVGSKKGLFIFIVVTIKKITASAAYVLIISTKTDESFILAPRLISIGASMVLSYTAACLI